VKKGYAIRRGAKKPQWKTLGLGELISTGQVRRFEWARLQ
jgi:hypothetical protein